MASTTRPGGRPFPASPIQALPPAAPREAVAAPAARAAVASYDPDRSLASHLHSCLSLLPDEQAAALRRRIPPRIPAAGLAEIAAELGISQQRVQGLINRALDRIDSTTGYREALAPRLLRIAREAPRDLGSVAGEGWARGSHPPVLPFFLAACGGLHVVAVPDHGHFVVPFDGTLWDEANRLLRAAAAVAAADAHPLSLTKGALGRLEASPEARLACSRLFGRIYAGCDVTGIRARLGLPTGEGEGPSGKGSPPAEAEGDPAERDATRIPFRKVPESPPPKPAPPPDAGAPEAVPATQTAAGDPPSPPAVRLRTRASKGGPTFVQAGMLALEEARYPLTFADLRDAIAERTGRQPSDASVWAALAAHGERLEGGRPRRGRDLWRLRVAERAPASVERSAPRVSAIPAQTAEGARGTTVPCGKVPPRGAVAVRRGTPSRPEWTTERDGILRRLWNAGESVRVIAERVGAGATRDTVMSRVVELKLF